MTPRTLRQWLGLVAVGPLALATLGSALVVVPGASRVTGALSVRLHRETGERIRAELRPLLDAPHAANEANARLADAAPGLPDEAWRRHLWRQLRDLPTVGYLQVGFAADGGFVGVERAGDGFVTEVSDAGRTGRATYALDAAGEPTGPQRAFVAGYDARTRPWYRTADAAGGPAWSPVYQFSSRDRARLGITAVRPWPDDGPTAAVLGADLVLSHLSDHLRHHDLGPDSRVVVLERDGLLVASSAHEAPFRVEADGTAVRLSGAACGDPTVEAAVRGAAGDDGTLADLGAETTFHVEGQWVYATPLADGRGLDWVLLVTVPEGEVLGDLPAELRTGLLVATLALVAGAAGSLLVARRVTRPLGELTLAARELAAGRFDAPLPPATTDETQALVAAFDAMRAELRRTLDEAERARSDAEAANRQKTSFVHGMSHELRTPLTAILGYTDLLLDDAEPGGPVADDLQRIRTAASHLLGLINDVLDLARVEAGQLTLSVVAVDARTVAEEVAAELAPVVAARGNALGVDAAPGDPTVETDRARLRQILVNLVGNAAKFTDRGTIRLTVVPDGDGVRIGVTDTGMGFDPATAARLLQPYVRAPGAQGREGTGLGLAIVHRLVEALGGTLAIASEPGKGSTFTVRLPRRAQRPHSS